MKEIVYMPNDNLHPLHKRDIDAMRGNSRYPLGLYFARYFDEPFTRMILSAEEKIDNIEAGTRADDWNHIDFRMTIDGVTYNVDSKACSFAGRMNGVYVDYVPVSHTVFRTTSYLLISVVYKGKIYMTPLDDFRFNMKVLNSENKTARFGDGSTQTMFYFHISEVIKFAKFVFDIPAELYDCYEQIDSAHRGYRDILFNYIVQNTDYAGRFEPFREDMIKYINLSNERFKKYLENKICQTRYAGGSNSYVSPSYQQPVSVQLDNSIFAAVEDSLAAIGI